MGNIPMSSLLGISMCIFGVLITLLAVQKCGAETMTNGEGTGQIVTIAIGVNCAAIGLIVHGVNLDFDPAMRSFAFAFSGANVSVAWKLWASGDGDWLDFVPVVAVSVVAGLVLGLLMSDGDVQKDTRARWKREAQEKQQRASNNAKGANDEKKSSD